MRTWLVASACAVVVLLTAPAAGAEPAHLLYRDTDGMLRTARLADASAFLAACVDEAPRAAVTAFGPPITLSVGSHTQELTTVATGDRVWLAARSSGGVVAGGSWCRMTDDVLAALGTARTAPANRGPWVAFIAGFGAMGVAVALVALWGRGIGPAPTLERGASEETDDHTEPASSSSTSASET